MGRNNLEARNKDINWGFNETTQKKFKFEFLNENDCRLLEMANGLNLKDVNEAIRINGKAQISLNDKLTIKGNTRIVVALTPEKDNYQQGRYKALASDFTGSTKVGLK